MNCPDCQRVIPDTYTSCPNCGARIPPSQLPARQGWNKRAYGIAAGVIGLLVVAGIMYSQFSDIFGVEPATAPSSFVATLAATLAPTPTPAIAAKPTPAGIPEPTATAMPTPIPTATPTPQPTYTPYPTPTPRLTATPIPRLTPPTISRLTAPPIPGPAPTLRPTATPRPRPTLRPTATPTPRPTRVPWVPREVKYADPEYTISVPGIWQGGRVTFFAKEHSSTPALWAQYNTIMGARRYDISSLNDMGVNLVGTYFKERYSSDELCGERGFVVIRETALVPDHRNVGIALHVDVCEADLPLEPEPGVSNQVISQIIITSLYRKN